ncbi:MAG TPA: phage holin family protein [Solirubrobacteraceae bacterium]|nr:phage holin family protein [Solirubrobacteraceae bacterium]
MSPQRYYEVVDRRPPAPPLALRLAISWLTNALVLAIVIGLLADVTVKNFGSLLLAAAVFGVLNTLLKPLLRFIALPLAILTLGIAWFFVSMLMLDITDGIVSGFRIEGFWTLVAATLIVWLVNLALDHTPGPWQVAGRRGRRNLRRGR